MSKIVPFDEKNDKEKEFLKSIDVSDIKTLRRVLNKTSKEEISNSIVLYTEIIAFLKSKYQNKMTLNTMIDWAVSIAISDSWFSNNLTARIANSVLVSALLITITSNFLLSPLAYGFNETDFESFNYLIFLCTSGSCTALFLMSIISGILFVDHILSRAYCRREKFILIIRWYTLELFSQTTAYTGAFLFPIACASSVIHLYGINHIISKIILGFGIPFYLLLAIIAITVSIHGYISQLQRIKIFRNELVDESNLLTIGFLKTNYYPIEAEITQNELIEMYDTKYSHPTLGWFDYQ